MGTIRAMTVINNSYALLAMDGVIHVVPLGIYYRAPINLFLGCGFICGVTKRPQDAAEHVNTRAPVTCIGCAVKLHTRYATYTTWRPSYQ